MRGRGCRELCGGGEAEGGGGLVMETEPAKTKGKWLSYVQDMGFSAGH